MLHILSCQHLAHCDQYITTCTGFQRWQHKLQQTINLPNLNTLTTNLSTWSKCNLSIHEDLLLLGTAFVSFSGKSYPPFKTLNYHLQLMQILSECQCFMMSRVCPGALGKLCVRACAVHTPGWSCGSWNEQDCFICCFPELIKQ